jgi:hypothetical protein
VPIAAFIVGQALIFDIARESRIAMAPVVAGFIASVTLGAWCVITLLRSHK